MVEAADTAEDNLAKYPSTLGSIVKDFQCFALIRAMVTILYF